MTPVRGAPRTNRPRDGSGTAARSETDNPAAPFSYHEREPIPAIAGVVLSFWAFESTARQDAPSVHTVWPDGCTSLAMALVPTVAPALMCVGATVDALRLPVTPGSRYIGVRFWPDAGAACTGYPAALLRDAVLPVPPRYVASWTALAARLSTTPQLDDAWPLLHEWAAQLAPRATPDPTVRRAVQAIAGAGGNVRVGPLAASLGISVRTLQRRFGSACGLTIKEYARIRRLRTALGARLQGTGESWSALATALGYADQSHLTREFVALSGVSPREAERRLAAIAHHHVRP